MATRSHGQAGFQCSTRAEASGRRRGETDDEHGAREDQGGRRAYAHPAPAPGQRPTQPRHRVNRIGRLSHRQVDAQGDNKHRERVRLTDHLYLGGPSPLSFTPLTPLLAGG